MATEIGIITTLIGTSTATIAGSQRILHIGDKVFINEVVSTGVAGAVEIQFADGRIMGLGRNSQVTLSRDIFEYLQEIQTPEEIQREVDAIQQALLAGGDPAEVNEATASGSTSEPEKNDGITTAQVVHDEQRITPTSGFDSLNLAGVSTSIVTETDGQNGTANLPLIASPEVLGADALQLFEDGPIVNGQIAVTAPNGSLLTFSLLEPAPAGLEFNSDGSYSFDPSHATYQPLAENEELAPIVLGVRAMDPLGQFVDTALSITVIGTNDAPIANMDVELSGNSNLLVTDEDTALTIDPNILLTNDSDLDGDTISLQSVSKPQNGTVEIDDGKIVFTPELNFNGEARFEYTITDGSALSDSATVKINVNSVNDKPISDDFSISTLLGAPIELDLNSHISDVDDDLSNTDNKVTMVEIINLTTLGDLFDASGNKVVVGERYDMTEITYAPKSKTILLGSKGGVATLDQWGEFINNDNRSLEKTVDNVTVISSSNNSKLKVYNNNAAIGRGLGDDSNGIEQGEALTIKFSEAIVTSAEVGLDGLGGHFNPDNNVGAQAIWYAKKGDKEVASGTVTSDQGTFFKVLMVKASDGFDELVFETVSASSTSDYVIRYIEAEIVSPDSFRYIAVDSDSLRSDESTVTIGILGDSGNQIVFGTDGDDQSTTPLVGTAGDDTLLAYDGEDELSGERGNDILYGGDGDDLFIWQQDDVGTVALPAYDVVMDFEGDVTSDTAPPQDVLDLADLLDDPNNGIEGIENNGHLRLKIGTVDENGSVEMPVQIIDLENITVGPGNNAMEMLNHLLGNGGIDDGQ